MSLSQTVRKYRPCLCPKLLAATSPSAFLAMAVIRCSAVITIINLAHRCGVDCVTYPQRLPFRYKDWLAVFRIAFVPR